MSNEKKKLKYGMLVDILSWKDKRHTEFLFDILFEAYIIGIFITVWS